MNMIKKGFTLVELLVVVSILAILGAISFISLKGYTEYSRDVKRLSEVANLGKALEVYVSKKGKLPLPENNIEITADGLLLGYQGYAGSNVLKDILYFNGGKDPQTEKYYSYYINASRDKYQLLTFLENENNISYNKIGLNKIYAENNIKFPFSKGSKLGILLFGEGYTPAQDLGVNIDIINTNEEYIVSIDSSKEGTFTGTGKRLEYKLNFRINEKGSCDAILKNGNSKGSGIYKINPTGNKIIEVYCDMENDGGGWTALMSVDSIGDTWDFQSSEWTNPTLKGNNFLTEETTYDSYSDLKTSKIKICRKNLKSCYTIEHNYYIPLKKFYTDNISYIDFSRFNYREDLASTHSYNINYPENIGLDKTSLFFNSLGISDIHDPIQYNKYGLGINLTSNNKIGFQGDNNNGWPGVDNLVVGIGAFAAWPVRPPGCSYSGGVVNDLAKSIMEEIKACHYDDTSSEIWYILGK